MTYDFDSYSAAYEVELNDAISFAGQDASVYTEAKARALLALARERVGDLGSASALDVGCGIGSIHRSLAPQFAEFQGVDVSAGLIDVARANNHDVAYQAYEGVELPFESNTFDLSFAICVLHHVPPAQWEAFTAEMARVVRPGGLVAVIEHNPLNPGTRLVTLRCAFDEEIRLVGRRRLQQLMRSARLTDRGSRYILFSPWRGTAVEKVERQIGRLPLGAQYIAYGNASP
jgi:SAM-dependent methyltransferase